MTRVRIWQVGGAGAFCLIAILNCGGYRYGIGDQAFYIPAVLQHLDPRLFPRDRLLLHAQDRFMIFDDLAALTCRTLGISLPAFFFCAYITAMILLFAAVLTVAKTLYRSWLAIAALTIVLTLRHRITQTGANTLEAYFHPRMLAFALGVWAMAAYFRQRGALALACVGLAFAMHPTTGIWFGVWLSVSMLVSSARWRVPLIALGAIGAAGAIWALAFGPLHDRLTRVDPVWASVMAGKDYIFPSDWGPAFWIVNFGYLALIAVVFQMRRRRGVAVAGEGGMVAGAAALAALFLLSWPFMAARVALALELQTSRVFWVVDLVASIYVAWLLAEAPKERARRLIVPLLAAVAIGRGVYVMTVEHAGDPIVAIRLPGDKWSDAMAWVSKTPASTHVLADPGHAWKFGTSVRAAGERDVLVEEVKDAAVALYSREAAMWVLGRLQDTQNFGAMTPEQYQALAARYDLNVLVIDRDVALPLLYRNPQFRIYQLGTPSPR